MGEPVTVDSDDLAAALLRSFRDHRKSREETHARLRAALDEQTWEPDPWVTAEMAGVLAGVGIVVSNAKAVDLLRGLRDAGLDVVLREDATDA